MQVLEASPGDWSDIWPFFRQIVAEGETYTYPTDMSREEGLEAWFAGASRVVLARQDGRVVGTARMGPNRLGNGDHVATASFMVDPGARTRGIGRTLGEDMLTWAHASGFRAVAFNSVVASNEPAVRLWESLGFVVVGTVPDAFRSPEHGLVGLHVMYRQVGGAAP